LTASGYRATPGVVLTITGGTQVTLALTASNTNAGAAAISYTINSAGVITTKTSIAAVSRYPELLTFRP
jgi:hypothetical protein